MFSEITSLNDLEIRFFTNDLPAIEKGGWIESLIENVPRLLTDSIAKEDKRLVRMKIDEHALYPIEIKQRAYYQLSLPLFDERSLYYINDEIDGLVGILGYDIYLSPHEYQKGIKEENVLLGGRGIQFGLRKIDRIHLMYWSGDGTRISGIKNNLISNPQLREYFPY